MSQHEEARRGVAPRRASELHSAEQAERPEDRQSRFTKQAPRLAAAHEFHPLADLFPLLEGEQFNELVDDIKANGLHEPIAILDGQILDGRNRYRACLAVGIEPRLIPFRGDDPAAYVVSKNLRRRHLNREQRGELLIKVIAAAPEKSDRQIAKTIGVDHKTIGAARAKGEDVGRIPHVNTRTDTKGRKQPTTLRKKVEPGDRATASNPIAEAWRRATQTQRREFALSYCTDIMLAQQRGGSAGPASDRAEAVRLAAEFGRTHGDEAPPADDGLDIPLELRRAVP
jgi:ParB-like chromosome segregation protein Spo0J